MEPAPWAGHLTVNGTLNWTGNNSTIGDTNGGTTKIASGGTLAISGTGTRVLGGHNNGSHPPHRAGPPTGSGTANIDDQGEPVEIGSGGKLDAKSDQSLTDSLGYNGSGNLLHVLSGGTLTKSAPGTGTTEIDIPVDNDGTTSASSGTLNLAGGSSNGSGGTFSPSAGAVIDFSGNTHTLNSGASLAGSGTFQIDSTVFIAGAVSSPAGSTVTLTGAGTLGGPGTLTVNGTLNWTGNNSTIGDTNGGTTKIASGGTLAISGTGTRVLGGHNNGSILRIDGTANWSGTANIDDQGEPVEIGSGGKLDAKSDQSLTDSLGYNGSGNLLHVLSGGTLTKSAPGTGTTEIDIPVDNDGTTSASSGTLNLAGGSSNGSGGTFSPSAGAVIDFSGNTHTLNSGASLAGSGTFQIDSTVFIAGAVSSPAGSTVTLTGAGTLGGPGTLTVNGTLNWTGNNSTIGDTNSGTTKIASGGTLAISGTGTRVLGRPRRWLHPPHRRGQPTGAAQPTSTTKANRSRSARAASSTPSDQSLTDSLGYNGSGNLLHVLSGRHPDQERPRHGDDGDRRARYERGDHRRRLGDTEPRRNVLELRLIGGQADRRRLQGGERLHLPVHRRGPPHERRRRHPRRLWVEVLERLTRWSSRLRYERRRRDVPASQQQQLLPHLFVCQQRHGCARKRHSPSPPRALTLGADRRAEYGGRRLGRRYDLQPAGRERGRAPRRHIERRHERDHAGSGQLLRHSRRHPHRHLLAS